MQNDILYIDTSDNKETVVGLLTKGKKYQISKKTENTWISQSLLPLIRKILTSHQMAFSDINGIEVVRGPGSFTGLRVGVAVANALGKLLDIPVNGSKDFQAEPVYE
ncbi:tRNA (adenosine(37)-N6)-threonylcarbamoyltransferase complex dimerization subunit type 1 TsaB [Patescibacteria group bacterium]|nr:tRNA (adenosine(37)-N6)-threonylcarbamoyltransferase complex dimerization subunit type 1 TsaB [Patescibacteria group bacterium]MCL5797810.1 tRNA (adenosine(37)-N6)-threonylcarbamoyltransferase complex dimerization subunit type 1 TsaB [Patescibacteria group bacterium]